LGTDSGKIRSDPCFAIIDAEITIQEGSEH